MKSFDDCKAEIAKKYKLGKTLVTGHLAKYWQEAGELFAEEKVNEVIKKYENKTIKEN